jgi:hypothetical protein
MNLKKKNVKYRWETCIKVHAKLSTKTRSLDLLQGTGKVFCDTAVEQKMKKQMKCTSRDVSDTVRYRYRYCLIQKPDIWYE